MQINAGVAARKHLTHHQVRQLMTQRPVRRAWKASVQVAAIGQVARTRQIPVHIDDRNRQERARQALERRRAQ